MPQEPKRYADLDTLQPYVRERVERVMAAMVAAGFDPIIFEARRSPTRQKWLYGVGRTHDKKRKPVTWTLESKHISGKAVDIISKRWGWANNAFFVALRKAAHAEGMHTIANDGAHIEWQG
jgi:peptidoglycan L-alanyl-D-glutamate endopeptidase CwlK